MTYINKNKITFENNLDFYLKHLYFFFKANPITSDKYKILSVTKINIIFEINLFLIKIHIFINNS